MAKKKQVSVTLVRSLSGRIASHKACVAGLGIRRMHHTVVLMTRRRTAGWSTRSPTCSQSRSS